VTKPQLKGYMYSCCGFVVLVGELEITEVTPSIIHKINKYPAV